LRQLESGVSAGQPRTTHALVPCSSAAAPVVRELLARDLAASSLDAGLADALVLAALEAVANAVVNGVRAGLDGRMLVIAWSMSANGFRFSVSDRGARSLPASASVGAVQRAGASLHPSMMGAGPAAPVPAVATPTCERRAAAMRAHPSAGAGRGRGVMEAVMDRVIVDAGQLGTRIVLEKALVP
jgi:anti-sigma regulatory factor (Ser/Thr protein kinase)